MPTDDHETPDQKRFAHLEAVNGSAVAGMLLSAVGGIVIVQALGTWTVALFHLVAR